MDIKEAFDEVFAAAKFPRRDPPEETTTELRGEAALEVMESPQLVVRAWHESLTPAQETVCRWIWEKCAKYNEPWERFEAGFLCECNVNHELVTWTRIALVFSDFVERHRSVDKQLVISELCYLSTGLPPRRLKSGQAKELTELWKKPPTEWRLP